MRPRSDARAPAAHPPRDPADLTRRALDAARRAGCVAAGVIAAGPAQSWGRYRAWLDAGLHAEMAWLERDAEPRREPGAVLSGCRSILSVAWPAGDPAPGNVARYARGEDYHVALKRVLRALADELRQNAAPGARFRACVDTAPLLEREIALRAGLGFLGKNGLLIVPGVGSHVVLGELLTDAELAPTQRAASPFSPDRCADCTRCLDACPTGAFVAPRILDASRCLSYLTIEKRGRFTQDEERAVAGAGMLFGCDVCQDVCPWNAPFFESPVLPRGEASLPLEPLVDMAPESYDARFGKSALWRATREGLARNAAALLASSR
jgi:epoxyqueuosine reductase